jgi:hypothetical protein
MDKVLQYRSIIGKRRQHYPDFSQDLRKEGSKTAKMYIAKQSQQLKA